MNKLFILGNLTKDAKVLGGKDGRSNVAITVAVNNGYGDKQTTDFIGMTGWVSEKLVPYLVKGTTVNVEGHVTVTTGTADNPSKTYLNVDRLDIVGGAKKPDATATPDKSSKTKSTKKADDVDDDDLPY